jgi:hypothetical protein
MGENHDKFQLKAEIGTFGIPLITLMMETSSISEMSVNFYQTTLRNDSENNQLQCIVQFATF